MDASHQPTALSMPHISDSDLSQVASLIQSLHSPLNVGNPSATHALQHQLQDVISSDIAWSLLSGLGRSSDPIVKFYGAQSAQTKIARDWESLPEGLRTTILDQVLDQAATLSSQHAGLEASASNGSIDNTAQYSLVVRKLFSCLAGLILRMTPNEFPSPILRVITVLSGRGVKRVVILEFLEIVIHDISRGALVEPRKSQLAKAIEGEMEFVVRMLIEVLSQDPPPSTNGPELSNTRSKYQRELEQAFKTLEAWIAWGLTAEDISTLLPILYNLLSSSEFLPQTINVLIEILTVSVFKDGKATKILTEPLLEWFASTGQGIVSRAAASAADLDNDADTESLIAVSKLVEAIVEHSASWLAGRTQHTLVQSFFNIIIQLTGFPGTATIDEDVSERTLGLYSQIQEALVEDDSFQEAYETSEAWGIAKEFFRAAVYALQQKITWPAENEGGGSKIENQDERTTFELYRRDAGEVMVTAYYVLRTEMLEGLLQLLMKQLETSSNEDWASVESTLHCIRYASEAVPLKEDQVLPQLFSSHVYSKLPRDREHRVALTALRLIRSYEEWFKYHTDSIIFVLDYVVTALDDPVTAPEAATALKAICDICRGNLVTHVSAFGALHGKVGQFQPEEQVKVIEAISSVLQALPPSEAVDAVVTITQPIVFKLGQCIQAAPKAPEAARQICMQQLQALTACVTGLTPSEEDMFDPEPEDTAQAAAAIEAVRQDPRLVELRDAILTHSTAAMEIWSSDSEMASTLSSFVKAMTASVSSQTLISVPSVPLLQAITGAAQKGINGLWLSLSSTLIFRLAPAPGLRRMLQRDPNTAEVGAEDQLKETVRQSTEIFVASTSNLLIGPTDVHAHPDVSEYFFKFASAVVSKFPSSFARTSPQAQSAAVQIATLGLGAQERFTLIHAIEFLVAILNTSRHSPSVAEAYDPVIIQQGRSILHAVIFGAGLHSPRSSIPNFAELLVALVNRVPNQTREWLTEILAEPTFPGGKSTPESKKKLQDTIMRVRTPKKLREALNDFALVCRGLAGTMYGSATVIPRPLDECPLPLPGPTRVHQQQPPKESQGKDLLQRLNFLYQANNYLNLLDQPDVPAESSKTAQNRRKRESKMGTIPNNDTFSSIASHTVLKIDPSVKRTVCPSCKIALVPGLTSKVRIRKSAVHENRVNTHCQSCQGTRKIPAPPLRNLDPIHVNSEAAGGGGRKLDGVERKRRKAKRTKPAAHWQIEAQSQICESQSGTGTGKGAPGKQEIKGKKAKANANSAGPVAKRTATKGHELWQGDKLVSGWGVPPLAPLS